MKIEEILNQKKYTDLNIHERIAVKSWWNSKHGNLALASAGGYYFNGYFIKGKYIPNLYTMAVNSR